MTLTQITEHQNLLLDYQGNDYRYSAFDLLDCLTLEERTLIVMSVELNNNYEVARQLNISESYVRKQLKTIKAKVLAFNEVKKYINN